MYTKPSSCSLISCNSNLLLLWFSFGFFTHWKMNKYTERYNIILAVNLFLENLKGQILGCWRLPATYNRLDEIIELLISNAESMQRKRAGRLRASRSTIMCFITIQCEMVPYVCIFLTTQILLDQFTWNFALSWLM